MWSVVSRPGGGAHLMSVVMSDGVNTLSCLTPGTRPDWLLIVNIMLVMAGLEIHYCDC